MTKLNVDTNTKIEDESEEDDITIEDIDTGGEKPDIGLLGIDGKVTKKKKRRKSTGDTAHLVASRHGFPAMYVPIVYQTKSSSGGNLILSGNDDFDMPSNFNNVNIIHNNHEKVYLGLSTCYTEVIGYNRIVGVDEIDRYICSDTYMDFMDEISDNGFVTSPAFLGTYPKIDTYKYDIDSLKIFDLNEAFDLGNLLYKKFPLRQGATVNFHGWQLKDVKSVACLLFIPHKRDRQASMATYVVGENEEDLNKAIVDKIIESDPKKNKYLRNYVSRYISSDSMNIAIGFFETAAHLTYFSHDAMMRLSGLSARED